MKRTSAAVFVMVTLFAVQRQAPAEEQTVCPVMEGNPISKNVFVEHEGKRVYFCCAACKAKFLKEPGKYLPLLPQFSEPATRQEAQGDSDEQHHEHSGAASLMEPLGICALVLLAATALSGFLLKKNRKLLLPWHKRLAVATLVVAASHALSVLLWD